MSQSHSHIFAVWFLNIFYFWLQGTHFFVHLVLCLLLLDCCLEGVSSEMGLANILNDEHAAISKTPLIWEQCSLSTDPSCQSLFMLCQLSIQTPWTCLCYKSPFASQALETESVCSRVVYEMLERCGWIRKRALLCCGVNSMYKIEVCCCNHNMTLLQLPIEGALLMRR